MNKLHILHVIILCNSFIIFLKADYVGVVKYPIIEMSSSFQPLSNTLPVSTCHRSHQALFNEIFTILEERGSFVKIACNKIKYNDSIKQNDNSFWTQKNNLKPIKILKTHVLKTIPHPVYGHEPTIVLVYPWKHFSVGTRFKHQKEHDTVREYAISYADFEQNNIRYDYIPKKIALKETQLNAKEMRHLFITTIENLIHGISIYNPDNIIPYVWGGNSFVTPYLEFEKIEQDGVWHRLGKNDPYTGYDCSGLVMRMAQIAGLNFPWKTTVVIEKKQKPLKDTDTLECGDLIWMPGHVMIISNIEKNELIEARGYKSGHGYVHKAKLNQIFENIQTYNDLLTSYYNAKKIRLKNKEGKFYLETDFKILKLI